MSLLIFGVAGFIGYNLARQALDNGYNVIGVDNLSSGSKANVDELREIYPHRFQFFLSSIESLTVEGLQNIPSLENVDCAINLAGQVSVAHSFDHPLVTAKSNLLGFVNLVSLLEKVGCKRLIYASSCSVYGESSSLPSLEQAKLMPQSPYAVSKYFNELYAGTRSDLRIELIGVRFFNIYGPRQPVTGGYAAVIPRWISSIILKSNVFVFGDGEQTRDFLYIRDLCDLLLIIAADRRKEDPQIYNACTGNSVSLNSLLMTIIRCAERLGCDYSENLIKYEREKIGDLRHSRGSLARICQRYSTWRPLYSLDKGVAETFQFYLDKQR